MNYQAKQEELDVKKWLVSEEKGADACGDFDYCKHCDKTIEYPCAVASEKADAANKPAVKKTASAKPAAKKADAKSEVAATSSTKTTTAKKPSASKSAAKK